MLCKATIILDNNRHNMEKRALFIDRDGIINHMFLQENGIFDSPQNLNQIKLVDGIVEVILMMNKINIPVIEVSNQPGVALQKMDWELLEDIENKIQSLLHQQDANINKIYRCFHHPKSNLDDLKINCECRKPKSGLLLQAADQYKLDLSSCVILGDNASDMEAGINVGCTTILFLHSNDLPHKIKKNETFPAQFKIHSHVEVIPILKQLFL